MWGAAQAPARRAGRGSRASARRASRSPRSRSRPRYRGRAGALGRVPAASRQGAARPSVDGCVRDRRDAWKKTATWLQLSPSSRLANSCPVLVPKYDRIRPARSHGSLPDHDATRTAGPGLCIGNRSSWSPPTDGSVTTTSTSSAARRPVLFRTASRAYFIDRPTRPGRRPGTSPHASRRRLDRGRSSATFDVCDPSMRAPRLSGFRRRPARSRRRAAAGQGWVAATSDAEARRAPARSSKALGVRTPGRT